MAELINVGGPPTDDKPTVTLEPPRDPDHVSGFLNIRVADIPPSTSSGLTEGPSS
jgi:hypothetical protein